MASRPFAGTAGASRVLKRGCRIDPPSFDGGRKSNNIAINNAAIGVLYIGGMHVDGIHQQAVCIDEDVPLLAFYNALF